MSKIVSVDCVSYRIGLCTNAGILLCLAQLGRSSAAIKQDETASESIATLKTLLDPKRGELPALRVSGDADGQTRVLVLPELCLSSGDAEDVDELVFGYPGKLMLVAGFGALDRDRLNQLLDVLNRPLAGAKTTISFTTNDLPPDSYFNIGVCWLRDHETRSTHRIVFGKNHPELRSELLLKPYRFSSHVRIDCSDVTLWPFICAEALESGGSDMVVENIAKGVANDSRHHLIVGLLRQCSKQSSDHWQHAIRTLTRAGMGGRSTLVVCNASAANIDLKKADRRNLTGVYADYGKWGDGTVADESFLVGWNAQLASWRIRTSELRIAQAVISANHTSGTSVRAHVRELRSFYAPSNTLQKDLRCGAGQDLSAALDAMVGRYSHGDFRRQLAIRVKESIDSYPDCLAEEEAPQSKLAIAWLSGPLTDTDTSIRQEKDRWEGLVRCSESLVGLMNEPYSDEPCFSLRFAQPINSSGANFSPAVGSLEGADVWFWVSPIYSGTRMVRELWQLIENDQNLCLGKSAVFGRGFDGDFDHNFLSFLQTSAPTTESSPDDELDSPDISHDLPTIEPIPRTLALKLFNVSKAQDCSSDLDDDDAQNAQRVRFGHFKSMLADKG